MTGRDEPVVPGETRACAGSGCSRRTVLRGAALAGLAGAAGLGLTGCGGGSDADQTIAGGAADPVPAPSPAAALPSKSDIYRRQPESRTPRGSEPGPGPVRPESGGEPAGEARTPGQPPADQPPAPRDAPPAEPSGEVPATRGSGDLATANRPGDDAGREPGRARDKPKEEPPPSPEPTLPPGALVLTKDIPVGGGKVFEKEKIVVTQPSAGDFKAFTAICTHTGCTVDAVAGGTINCPCHGSKYGIADGAVREGPAPEPLAAEKITVADGSIRRG